MDYTGKSRCIEFALSAFTLYGKTGISHICLFYCRRLSSYQKYLLKLLVFAFLSELPFDLAIYGAIHWQYQNVFFILALGVLMLELFVHLPLPWHVPVLAGLSLLSWLCRLDYMVVGLVLIAVFYWLRNRRVAAIAAGALTFIWEPWSVIGFFLLLFYNGQRGRGMKYFFYLFYPVHLLFLYLLWRFWL